MKVANRTYASFKFMIYTMAGSLGLLLAIQMLGVVFKTFDLPYIVQQWNALAADRRDPRRVHHRRHRQDRRLLGLHDCLCPQGAGLALPHLAAGCPHRSPDRWLDDPGGRAAQTGCLRLPALCAAALSGAGAWLAPISWPGWRLRRSSLAHLLPSGSEISNAWWRIPRSTIWALCVLGIAAAARAIGTESATIALNGAVLQMFNHGLSAAGMFFLVGVIYDRIHTRRPGRDGRVLPAGAGLRRCADLHLNGLARPAGLNGFVSEFLVVRGAWPISSRSGRRSV